MSGEIALQLRDVRLQYPVAEGGGLAVLDIPEFTLAAGAAMALLGPSGCGKTSLLQVLAGITQADRGSVTWFGTDLSTLSPRQCDRWRWQQLGLVFQQFHLVAGMTALANVLLPLQFGVVADRNQLRARGAALLDQVGIRPQQSVDTLSRGQMQRVAIARALLFSPRIVLADEPTASLDAAQGVQTMQLLRQLCDDHGTTLVVATHDLQLASTLPLQYRLQRGQLIALAEAVS